MSLSNLPLLLLLLTPAAYPQKSIPQPSTSSTPTTDFTCPEDFGYFPHPSDCTQYYVCVFGGALLESCTGGLMYSHDLQTCDWPRNVYCYNGTTFVDNNNVQQQQQSPHESRTRTRGGTTTQQQTRGNPSYSYSPIKIETYGQLSRAQQESSVVGKKPGRVVLPDDEYQQQRSGRSYEGSLPNYKEEIYQQGRLDDDDNLLHADNNVTLTDCTSPSSPRHKRSTSDRNSRRRRRPQHHRRSSIFDMITTRRTPRSRSNFNNKNSLSRMDMHNPHHLSKYKINPQAGLKHKPVPEPQISHRVSSPGSVLYPPSYYQTPTYGFVNIEKFSNPRLRPNPPVSITTPPPQSSSRIVKITTTKPFNDNAQGATYYSSHQQRYSNGNVILGEYDRYNQPSLVNSYDPRWNAHHHHQQQVSEHEKTLSEFVNSAYVNRLKANNPGGSFDRGSTLPPPVVRHHQQQQYHRGVVLPQSNEFPKKIVISTGSLSSSGNGGLPFVVGPTGTAAGNNNNEHLHPPNHHVQQQQHHLTNTRGSVSSSPLATTRSKYAGNTNKYYDNTASILQQQQQATPQAQDYGTDDAYVNQRYAANVGNNTNQYFYTPGSASEDDDSSYYVYDDEEDDGSTSTSAGGAAAQPQKFAGQSGFADYKYQQPQFTRTPAPPVQTVTRRPTTVQPTSSRTASRGSSRTRTGGSSSSSSSSSSSTGSTRSRPTLKPKSSIVKQASAPVRDVYLDPPSRPDNIYETPAMNTPATKCRKDLCVLPDCSCGGKEIPGGLRAEETPQIVILTFDDSVNDLNKNLYRDLFEKGRKNPNGCPISATFYISHEWTDYSQVQNLAADGHEIASHSVSHSFGEQYSQKKWDREINGQREILAAYGGVKLSEVRGMRAPFLAIGGNNMFKMLHDSNFTYDSSMPIYENRPPSWPYTLDYRIFHDCMIPPCPTKSYPGVWEVPMVMWQDLKGGRCSMGDACSNPPTAEGVYQMLAKNFERHYTTNRAPFGLYYHAAWFTQPHHKEGFEAFLDTLVQMEDVWLVTNWQALQWIRNPTPNNRILNFDPWSCHNNKDRPPRCNHPKVCNLWHKSGVRYMKTCQQCPQQYPWTGNTGVPYSNSL